jgi:hypothetical protein
LGRTHQTLNLGERTLHCWASNIQFGGQLCKRRIRGLCSDPSDPRMEAVRSQKLLL